MMKCLHSYGNNIVEEYDIPTPKCPNNGILVKTLMTGVCRSDIAQYQGLEKGVPLGVFGHEGLGQVIEVGKNFVSDRDEPVFVGNIVSSWSDPAYADFYTAKANEFVIVPEASPKFILQPVACALNIYFQTRKFMKFMGLTDQEILLLGSGFMATIIGEASKAFNDKFTVVGRANADVWDELKINRFDSVGSLQDATHRKFKVIIDISSKAENFHFIHSSLAEHEALIAYAGTPTEDVQTNFFENCWACHTFIMPSPRNSDFNDAMAMARDLVIQNKLDTERLWTQGYDRYTEFKQAFSDGAFRSPGYIRGYLRY